MCSGRVDSDEVVRRLTQVQQRPVLPELSMGGNPVSKSGEIRCQAKSGVGEIRCQFIILGEIRCQFIILWKSGVSSSFLPEKMN